MIFFFCQALSAHAFLINVLASLSTKVDHRSKINDISCQKILLAVQRHWCMQTYQFSIQQILSNRFLYLLVEAKQSKKHIVAMWMSVLMPPHIKRYDCREVYPGCALSSPAFFYA